MADRLLVQQLVNGKGRVMPVQDLSRPIIEHHCTRLLSAHDSRVNCLSLEELTSAPVGVLIRVPLPGSIRVGKVDPDRGLLCKEAVPAGSAVRMEGLARCGRILSAARVRDEPS
jgi:hypothetical protein